MKKVKVLTVSASPTVPSPSPQPSPLGRGGPAVLVQVDPGRVRASATNPRKVFEAVALGELTESVRQHGVVQPLIVRRVDTVAGRTPHPGPLPVEGRGGPKVAAGVNGAGSSSAVEYELVAGERRWRAATAAGVKSIPVMVMELTDPETIEIQYLENLQRVDLSVLEEAEGFAALIKSGRYTADSLAVKLGKSRSHVFGRLKLCKLSAAVRTEMDRGNLDATAAGLIASVPDPKDQGKLVKLATGGRWDGDVPMSFRQLKELIGRQYQKNLSGAPWKWDDAGLVAKAGGCQACPKRSGNMEGFEGGPNVCTDLKCWGVKQAAFGTRQMAEAEKNGQTILTEQAYRRGNYRTAEDGDYFGNAYKKVGEVLKGKKSTLQPALVSINGNVVEVYERGELNAEFKRLGVRNGSTGGGNASWKREEAKRRAKALLQGKVERAALKVIRAKARTGRGPKFWELIAGMLLAGAHWDPLQAMLKDRGLAKGGDWNDRAKPLRESLKDEESRREAVVELLARECENLKAAAEWAGVDLKKVEAEVKSQKGTKETKGKKK